LKDDEVSSIGTEEENSDDYSHSLDKKTQMMTKKKSKKKHLKEIYLNHS
jgi:hypothetical protein